MELRYLADRIREELNESNHGVFFTDADIYDSIEDGYTLICLFTGLLGNKTNLEIIANKVYYDLSNISDYVRPIAIFDPNTKIYLKPIDSDSLNRNITNWEMSAGTPMYFCYFPTKLIAFFPHYSYVPAISYFELYYKAWPANFKSSSTIDLPKFAENCLIYYCVSDLYDQLLEIEKSVLAWNKFIHDLEFCKSKISRLSAAGELVTMEGQ